MDEFLGLLLQNPSNSLFTIIVLLVGIYFHDKYISSKLSFKMSEARVEEIIEKEIAKNNKRLKESTIKPLYDEITRIKSDTDEIRRQIKDIQGSLHTIREFLLSDGIIKPKYDKK